MGKDACCKSPFWNFSCISGLGLTLVAAVVGGFWLGTNTKTEASLPLLHASTSAASSSMAVATGQISDNVEGIFFLDYVTGDLQCLVYYPRIGVFGARYTANVLDRLPANGRNAQYLMVTGTAIPTGTTGAARPGSTLVYVTDATSGTFAAYAVPWDRTAEAGGRLQSGPLVFIGGGPIRDFQLAPGSQASQSGTATRPQPADAKKKL
jgi:hypothetical protein